MKRLFLGVIALAIVAGTSACNRHHSAEEKGKWMVKMVSAKLDLTPDQKGKLEEVRKAFEAAHKSGEADRKSEFEAVKAQILGPKLDAAFAKDLIKKREAKIDQNFDPVFTKIQEFHASLSDRQKKIAVESLEKFADQD